MNVSGEGERRGSEGLAGAGSTGCLQLFSVIQPRFGYCFISERRRTVGNGWPKPKNLNVIQILCFSCTSIYLECVSPSL